MSPLAPTLFVLKPNKILDPELDEKIKKIEKKWDTTNFRGPSELNQGT